MPAVFPCTPLLSLSLPAHLTDEGGRTPASPPTSRYRLYGEVSARAAAQLRQPAVERHFARLIQRVAPKSYPQASPLLFASCSLLLAPCSSLQIHSCPLVRAALPGLPLPVVSKRPLWQTLCISYSS